MPGSRPGGTGGWVWGRFSETVKTLKLPPCSTHQIDQTRTPHSFCTDDLRTCSSCRCQTSGCDDARRRTRPCRPCWQIVLPTDGVTEADMSALAVALSPDEDGIQAIAESI